ncbi:MAG TPA: T9SS type A sorting domain-containing protein [Bacteroidia bacterium]|nr:T9SS type A sorting domain-containing protein [Bacteroidia bacterium]HQK97774.1 T9SS type A sorting domain-containing protein [Bacteroidia bacterium]
MKAKLTLLFTCGILFAKAQFIDQISVFPPNPTTNDEIHFIANCYFGSGTCDQKSQYISINGSEISASAIHCLGMLTYICNETDSFYIGYLPTGTYQVNFQLNAGSGPVPCTPGIVPGPSDSLTFTVQSATGITEIGKSLVKISPNPTRGKAVVSISGTDFIGKMEVRNLTGALLKEWNTYNRELSIDLSNLAPGVYQLIFTSESGKRSVASLLRAD